MTWKENLEVRNAYGKRNICSFAEKRQKKLKWFQPPPSWNPVFALENEQRQIKGFIMQIIFEISNFKLHRFNNAILLLLND